MGLEPFEAFFLFDFFLLNSIYRSSKTSKIAQKLSEDFPLFFSRYERRIFLCVKSLMGTPLDSSFFTQNFIFQLPKMGQGGIQIKICFATIEDLPI